MLRPLLISAILLTICSFQTDDSHWTSIQKAIQEGDATALSIYFNNVITLSVPGNQGNYSRKQARTILQKFFSNHPPRSFSLKTTGHKSASSQYYLCQYISKTGKVYTLYILLRKESKQPQIIQFTIE